MLTVASSGVHVSWYLTYFDKLLGVHECPWRFIVQSVPQKVLFVILLILLLYGLWLTFPKRQTDFCQFIFILTDLKRSVRSRNGRRTCFFFLFYLFKKDTKTQHQSKIHPQVRFSSQKREQNVIFQATAHLHCSLASASQRARIKCGHACSRRARRHYKYI